MLNPLFRFPSLHQRKRQEQFLEKAIINAILISFNICLYIFLMRGY